MAFDDEDEYKSNKPKRAARKRTRAVKVAQEAKPHVKEKFIEDVVPKPSHGVKIEPRGANQIRMLNALRAGKQIVFGLGVAGSGKSLLAAYYAAEMLKAKRINKIFLIRPNVHCGKSVGMLKGGLEEKLLPFFLQTIAHLEKFLGVGYTKYCLEKKIIEMFAVEYCRGTSFEDCFVICEEAQGFTTDDFEMMLTRIGQNAQLCFTGDERQVDLKETTGLSKTIEMFEKVKNNPPSYLDSEDMNEFLTNLSITRFTFEDVQRSPMVKALTKLYYYKEK